MESPNASAIVEMAKSLGIDIPEAYRESVIGNFQRLMVEAALVMKAQIPGDVVSAEEFEP